MTLKNTAVITSESSWFIPHVKKLVSILNKKQYKCELYYDHGKIKTGFDVVFILSYFKIIDGKFLKKNKHNLIVHESDLPKGRGWAPLFWQILEGKNKIPIVLFEASKKLDQGQIYLREEILLKGHELHGEIREKQAKKTIELCLRFLTEYNNLKAVRQYGKVTHYRRRTSQDSELNINKSIKEQFNLLRIVSNKEFPAFFYYRGKRYILKIFEG